MPTETDGGPAFPVSCLASKTESLLHRNRELKAINADLLAACEEMAKAFHEYEMDNGDAPQFHRDMMRRARAAIHKAKGGA